jgi:protein-disulfide isomerase
MMISRRLLIPALLAAPALARAEGWFDLRADDGLRIANHRVPNDLAAGVDDLPGAIIAGNPQGDVTLSEFYDHNCGFCRRAAVDVAALVAADPNLKLVLIVIPQLSIGSVEAAKVELAVQALAGDATAFAFHRRIYATRGAIDGSRALAVASDLGLERREVEDMANREAMVDILKSHVRLANALNLGATPAYVLQGIAMVGHPGRKSLGQMIASVRRCDRVMCG